MKETYSDLELSALLKKPDIRKATFAEYRDWVIINFLLNCGSRATTVRAIQIRDVDLDGGVVFYRHTKNRKPGSFPFVVPWCPFCGSICGTEAGRRLISSFAQKPALN